MVLISFPTERSISLTRSSILNHALIDLFVQGHHGDYSKNKKVKPEESLEVKRELVLDDI